MSKDLTPKEGDIIFYTTPDGAVHIEVFFQNETLHLLECAKRAVEISIE
jgi:hypothetical protein